MTKRVGQYHNGEGGGEQILINVLGILSFMIF